MCRSPALPALPPQGSAGTRSHPRALNSPAGKEDCTGSSPALRRPLELEEDREFFFNIRSIVKKKKKPPCSLLHAIGQWTVCFKDTGLLERLVVFHVGFALGEGYTKTYIPSFQ